MPARRHGVFPRVDLAQPATPTITGAKADIDKIRARQLQYDEIVDKSGHQ